MTGPARPSPTQAPAVVEAPDAPAPAPPRRVEVRLDDVWQPGAPRAPSARERRDGLSIRRSVWLVVGLSSALLYGLIALAALVAHFLR